jgi:hypothetical protein
MVRILVLYHVRPGRRIWIGCFVDPSSKADQPVEYQSIAMPSIFHEFHVKAPAPRYALALSSFEVSHPGAAFSLAASGELQLRVGGKQNESRCLN